MRISDWSSDVCSSDLHAGRPGGFLFEGEVHALVTAVLLRLSRLDALDGDTEPEPPHRQLRQVEEGVGAGEGDAVVGANGVGQAPLLEQLLERGDGGVLAGRRDRKSTRLNSSH